ncbi:hypothetical protein ACFSSE_01910 [Pedobacter alpinus]|uniref:Lipocalin-like domain-containing protein n=2 Tax=Pedobacter alpinus TaxID=1590643 RepID=A0ABW5TQQ5_9SPHI
MKFQLYPYLPLHRIVLKQLTMKKQIFKPKTILFYFLLGVLPFTSIYCKKENKEIFPNKTILGKWKVTHNMFGPVNYNEYIEYLPDSIYLVHNIQEDSVYKGKYWIADSILYKRYVYLDQNTDATLLVDILPYKFEFKDINTLELNLQFPALNPYSRYKRIN